MKKILALCCGLLVATWFAITAPAFALELPKNWASPPIQQADEAVTTPLAEVAAPANVAGSCQVAVTSLVCTVAAKPGSGHSRASSMTAVAPPLTADPIDPGRA